MIITSMKGYVKFFGQGSGSTDGEILRYAQDDSQDSTQVRTREAFSPNVGFVAVNLDKSDRNGYTRRR